MRPCFAPFAFAVAACSGASSPPPDADEALACLASGRGDVYRVGLEKTGQSSKLSVKLMSADPAPPARNLNTWIIQVNAMPGGAPLSGATMTVTPFMPDHQHGAGAYRVQVEAMPDAGQYRLSQINTWMPGYWEVTIDAQAGDVRDTVVFGFCIQA